MLLLPWPLCVWLQVNIFASFVTLLTKYLNYSTFSSGFWFIKICIGDSCLSFPLPSFFSTFISIPQHFPISINPSVVTCSSVFSLASSSRSSVYFTVIITCRSVLMSYEASRTFLVIIAHISSVHTKHMNAFCGHSLEVLNTEADSMYIANHWDINGYANLSGSINIFRVQYFRDGRVSLTWYVRRGFKFSRNHCIF